MTDKDRCRGSRVCRGLRRVWGLAVGVGYQRRRGPREEPKRACWVGPGWGLGKLSCARVWPETTGQVGSRMKTRNLASQQNAEKAYRGP